MPSLKTNRNKHPRNRDRTHLQPVPCQTQCFMVCSKAKKSGEDDQNRSRPQHRWVDWYCPHHNRLLGWVGVTLKHWCLSAGRAEGPQEKPGQLRRGGAAAGRAAADHWPAEVSTGELRKNDAHSSVLSLVTSCRLVMCYITYVLSLVTSRWYRDHAGSPMPLVFRAQNSLCFDLLRPF